MIEHSTVAVRGANLHVARAGRGRPLLLLHGWPEFWLTWEPVMTRLANRFDLIAPDLRGFGGSDKPEGPFGPAEQAEDLVGLLDALGIGSVGIVSHDVGATITQTLARRHPNRIVGLFFFNFMYPGIGKRFTAPIHLEHVWHTWFNQSDLAPDLLAASPEAVRRFFTFFLREVGAPEGGVRRRRDRCVRGQLPGAR
jgi:pimeloyl-ACP methyl ester carboxylesterase